MNIAYIDYSLRTKSLDIYISGCYGNCDGCHNPELFDFNIGDRYCEKFFEKKIKSKIQSFSSMIENIMIFGGDPLDQNADRLGGMLEDLTYFEIPIWLFTRHSYFSIPQNVKKSCTYIKTGAYDNNNLVDNNIWYGIKLASNNQKIWKI